MRAACADLIRFLDGGVLENVEGARSYRCSFPLPTLRCVRGEGESTRCPDPWGERERASALPS